MAAGHDGRGRRFHHQESSPTYVPEKTNQTPSTSTRGASRMEYGEESKSEIVHPTDDLLTEEGHSVPLESKHSKWIGSHAVQTEQRDVARNKRERQEQEWQDVTAKSSRLYADVSVNK